MRCEVPSGSGLVQRRSDLRQTRSVDRVQISKLLSLVLRHDPARLGLELDGGGWVAVEALLAGLAEHGHVLTRSQLLDVVGTSDKQRFAWDVATDRVRANQGHSVPVYLGLAPAVPPAVLFHGTPVRSVESILREGLSRRARHAVHLSADLATAHRVGARRGEHVILVVDAASLHAAGHQFTISANGVWLTESVPPRFLSTLEAHDG